MITFGVPPGTYRHKKGGRYLVRQQAVVVPHIDTRGEILHVASARHSDDLRLVVVGIHVKTGAWVALDPQSELGTVLIFYTSLDHRTDWVRPEHEWHDIVEWEDGVKRKRFVREDFE